MSGFNLGPEFSAELSALATQIEATMQSIANNPNLSPASRAALQQQVAQETAHFTATVRGTVSTLGAAKAMVELAGILGRALGNTGTRALGFLTLNMQQIQSWIEQNFGLGKAEAMDIDPMEHAVVTEFGPRVSVTPDTMVDLDGFIISQMAPPNQSARGVAGWVETSQIFGLGKGSSGAGAPSTDNGGISAGGEGGVSGTDSGTGDSPGGTDGGGQAP